MANQKKPSSYNFLEQWTQNILFSLYFYSTIKIKVLVYIRWEAFKMSETKVVGVEDLKFPIRSMQFSIMPDRFNSAHGAAWTTNVSIWLHILAEVKNTRFASFVFGCKFNGYSNSFTYGDNLVDCLFIDGSDSYLCLKETHYQSIDKHLLSEDTVKNLYSSIPYQIQIGRDSPLATMCPPAQAPQPNTTSIKESE